MQSVSSRIWTRVAVSNSYDDNHNTTGTSFQFISISRSLSLHMPVSLLFIVSDSFVKIYVYISSQLSAASLLPIVTLNLIYVRFFIYAVSAMFDYF